jgi:c-di-GMP-related signal transduction protein
MSFSGRFPKRKLLKSSTIPHPPLHLRVATDGVETREQFDFLKNHGCQEGQGSYFSAAIDRRSSRT